MGYRPGHDNDEVQLVPLVAEVTIGAKNSQRHHLDDHFHGKESKDAIIQNLQKTHRWNYDNQSRRISFDRIRSAPRLSFLITFP